MQIISDDGFYEYYNEEKENTQEFEGSFKGTIVNLQFRIDDNNSYLLEEEISDKDIF